MAKEADQAVLREWVYENGVMATRLNNACRGLADDCGELNGAVKKWLEYQQPLDKANVLEEIGDCLWRLAQAATAIGYTLEEVMEANIRKLELVRYKDTICNPIDAAEENRDRDKEAEAMQKVGEFGPTGPILPSINRIPEDDGPNYEELESLSRYHKPILERMLAIYLCPHCSARVAPRMLAQMVIEQTSNPNGFGCSECREGFVLGDLICKR